MGHPGVQEPWHVQKHFVGIWEVFRLPRCRAGPQRRRRNQDTEMYDLKKSDVAIVAVKPANNGRQRLAEQMEPRAAAKENAGGQRMRRTQSTERVSWRLTGYESCEEKPGRVSYIPSAAGPAGRDTQADRGLWGSTPNRSVETTTRHCRSR